MLQNAAMKIFLQQPAVPTILPTPLLFYTLPLAQYTPTALTHSAFTLLLLSPTNTHAEAEAEDDSEAESDEDDEDEKEG